MAFRPVLFCIQGDYEQDLAVSLMEYWEQCVKDHLRGQKKQYLIKISKKLKIFNDTSPEMIRILIEMRRTLRGEHHER